MVLVNLAIVLANVAQRLDPLGVASHMDPGAKRLSTDVVLARALAPLVGPSVVLSDI